MNHSDQVYDVVVVGAGNAALTAALSAKHSGANVIVLEKASEELRGGNTRFSGGVFRCTYRGMDDLAAIVRDADDAEDVTAEPYAAEDFHKDIARTTGGRADAVLTSHMVDRSYETVKWMADLGVQWEFNRAVGTVVIKGQKTKLPFGTALRVVHEGIGLSDSLFRLVQEAGIPVRYETDARRLVVEENGRVTGVEVRTPQGNQVIRCRAAILASGGFQANPEMRTAYLGAVWNLVKVRGTRFNSGQMIRAALEVGAQGYGQWSGCHATPIDADAPVYGDLRLTDKTNRLSFHHGILINLDGKRFFDEGEDFNSYTYAKLGGIILQQRNAVAFEVFDQKTVHLLEKRYNTGEPVQADSIEGLAEGIDQRFGRMGFRKEAFVRTVGEYNGAVLGGTFNPNILDGLSTAGLQIDKTNWAQLIDKPPYLVYAVTGGITFTFGGVLVNTDAAVVDHLDRPIPGLFCTGEMLGGFFFSNYPLGSGLTRGAVYGRIAGQNAAAFAHDV